MTQNWDDVPKIKVDGFDSSDFSLQDDVRTEVHPSISMMDDYEQHESNDQDEQERNKNQIMSLIGKKHVISIIAICLIVIVPIIYHFASDYIQAFFFNKESNQTANVKLKYFTESPIYTTSESIGVIVPEDSVDVVSRADGYLQETLFKEGDFVQKGQILFKIEPRELQIAVRTAQASVAQAKAIYINSQQELDRAKELIKENFISHSDYDSIVATANSNRANLDAAEQELARAKLNLSYSNIYSPLTGKAGKIALSNGNYIGLQTVLVNVAKTTPICVSFSMKSAEAIQLKTSNHGNLDLSNSKVELILADNTKYPLTGKITFSDNIIASDAATLSLKAVFDNPDNVLVPGDYVKVIVTSAQARHNILIPHEITYGDAVNGYYLWCVKDGKTVKKPIKILGSQLNDWIVESGITKDDAVVVDTDVPIDMEDMHVVVKATN